MANMIIKPAVGGNLLIQDRAGGAVLSTGTSGAAIASGVTGGAGLSGMTSLGTVTSGNLSNSAIVYPDNHMVFIDSFIIAGGVSGTDNAATDTGLTITIPSATVAKYSKLICNVRNYYRINQSDHTFVWFKFVRSAPSTVALHEARYGHHGADGHDMFGEWGGTFSDESLGSGDHTYKTQYYKSQTTYSGTIYYLGEDGNHRNEISVFGVI